MPINRTRLAISLALVGAAALPIYTRSVFRIGPSEMTVLTEDRASFLQERGVKSEYNCILRGTDRATGLRPKDVQDHDRAVCREALKIPSGYVVPVA